METDIYRYLGENIFQKEDKSNLDITLTGCRLHTDHLGHKEVVYTYYMRDVDFWLTHLSTIRVGGIIDYIVDISSTVHTKDEGLQKFEMTLKIKSSAINMFRKHFINPFKVTQEELTLFETDSPELPYVCLKIEENPL